VENYLWLRGLGFLTVIQQGPISFLFSRKSSRRLALAPKIFSIEAPPAHCMKVKHEAEVTVGEKSKEFIYLSRSGQIPVEFTYVNQ
jgi:hypothetical protein